MTAQEATEITKIKWKCKDAAQYMSKTELNNKVNECLDSGEHAEATAFAKIWMRRYGNV